MIPLITPPEGAGMREIIRNAGNFLRIIAKYFARKWLPGTSSNIFPSSYYNCKTRKSGRVPQVISLVLFSDSIDKLFLLDWQIILPPDISAVFCVLSEKPYRPGRVRKDAPFCIAKPLARPVVQKSLRRWERKKNSLCYNKRAVCQLHKRSKGRTFKMGLNDINSLSHTKVQFTRDYTG